MGGLIDIEQKGWEFVINDHGRDLICWWPTLGVSYRIVTGMILDVRVPSTYLVL